MSTEKLSKPVGYYRLSEDRVSYYLSSPTEKLDEKVVPLYSQEYVSALLARIAELGEREKRVVALAGGNADLWETMAARLEAAEAKLATPVQLQNCDFESVAILAHWCTDEQLKAWVKGVEHAKKQIRAAGFKVEGDE